MIATCKINFNKTFNPKKYHKHVCWVTISAISKILLKYLNNLNSNVRYTKYTHSTFVYDTYNNI